MEIDPSAHKLPPLAAPRLEGWLRPLNAFVRCAPIEGNHAPRYQIRWRRVLLALTGGTVLGYATLAAAALVFVRTVQGIENVGYIDLLLPQRWHHYRAARGEHDIATAQKLVQTGRRREALLLLRNGLARAPENRDGRLLFARLLIEGGRPDFARQVFLDGVPLLRGDPAFLQPLFTFLLAQQQDTVVIGLARKFLPSSPAATEPNRLFALAAATASFFRGNYDAAEDFLRSVPKLAASRDGRLLAAKIEHDRGYRELALVRFRELAAEFPHDLEIHTELAALLARRGLTDEARRLALAFQIAHPALPGPRIELLRAYHHDGDRERVAREADAFIRDFAGDSAALLALADFAANTGDAPLARRLLAHAKTHEFPWEAHSILAVEALVVARDFRGAITAGQNLLQENPGWAKTFLPVVNSLLAIAHLGLGDTEAGQLLLTNYLNQSYLRAENLLAIAQRLVDVDAADQARTTLARAVAADPLNQAALTRLVELDLNLNRIDELPAHLTRLLAMRRPSPDIMRVAQHKLGSDLFLFSPERPAALEAVRVALEKTSAPVPRR